MGQNKFGSLITDDILLFRGWFQEMCELQGVCCKFKAPKSNKDYDVHGDLVANYEESKDVYCMFDKIPDQKTLKKQGWVTELEEGASILHIPYDLEGVQKGAIFEIPSGLDDGDYKPFRVLTMSTIAIYPASIAIEVAPEYFDEEEQNSFEDFSNDSMTLLVDVEGDK